jgi:diguanylate cyclase (GGDEF)-like protein
MSGATNPLEQQIADERAFQESLVNLGQNVSWLKWTSLAATVFEIVLIAVLAFSESAREWIVGAVFTLLLFSNAHVFLRQRHLRKICDCLAEQKALAEKHRARAQQFYGLAVVDPLTGLYNRRFGEERLKEELLRTEKNDDPFAILLMDLDYFKEINDQFGHAAGDLVLKEFSRRLKRAIRACDVPVRIGGDEFLVLLPECARENVDIILSRLGSFEVHIEKQKIQVGCSIGRAHYQVADTPETILQRADELLYAVKAARGDPRGRAPRPLQVAHPDSAGGAQTSSTVETRLETFETVPSEAPESAASSSYSGEPMDFVDG